MFIQYLNVVLKLVPHKLHYVSASPLTPGGWLHPEKLQNDVSDVNFCLRPKFWIAAGATCYFF